MVSGHLQEKNGQYHMVINYKDANGKRVTKWVSTGLPVKGNKRKAESMLVELRQSFEPEVPLKPGEGLLFTDFFSEWLRVTKPNIEVTTLSAYDGIVRRVNKYFEPKKILLKDFATRDIQEFYSFLFDEWKVTANTVIHYHANIRKALQYAVKIGYIPTNPALYVERPKIQEYTGSVYDVDEINNLLTVVKDMKIEMGVMFAAFYGLRRSEIIGLKWDAIDFKNNRISIKHTVSSTSIDGKYIMVSKDRAKNKSSMRSLPLVPVFAEYLVQRRERQEEYKRLCGRSYNYDYEDYIYVDEMGNLTKPHFLTDNFDTILKNNNLRKIRFHDLRHSCASVLLANGVSLKEIQEWLGHSSFSTTANIYAHLDKGAKDRSAAAMLNTGIKIGSTKVTKNHPE